MSLAPRTRLGVYDITAQLGAGGMGEVYRATDTNLKRQVAIKVLPASLAADADRLARFQREAEVLAALNHPHIAAIYGLEKTADFTALVMELVEGEDLSQRIARGALPIDEALPIATQIAEALEAAHEQGIIHRDLKPANIKVRSDGTVKVLDFGLAKTLQDPKTSGPQDFPMSPTITTPAMTQAGMILGTAAYMAPEQARGKAVDRRADIWAFGCVLYEMVTGNRAFAGEDITETLAAVVMKEPVFDAVPAELGPLLAKCLQKDPKKRLRDISGFESLCDLGRAQSGSLPETAAPVHAKATASPLPWAVAAALAVATVVALWAPWRATPAVERPLVRFDVELGPGAVAAPGISAILSPDGTRVVYPVRGSDIRQSLVTRRLDQKDATPLLGTESLFHQSFFSPDGQWIGFRSSDSLLKKVSVQGGSAVVVGPWPGSMGSGASWGDDGNIVIGTYTGLVSVPSSGGQPRQLTQGNHSFPDVLPGAKAVLYAEDAGLVTRSLDSMTINVLNIETGETRKLLDDGYWPRYIAASPGAGYLTYVNANTLLAVDFDLERLQLRGTPVPVLDDVAANSDYFSGGGQVAVSRSGTLVYLSGVTQSAYPLVWIDGAGAVTRLAIEPGLLGAPRVSPDGKSVAYLSKGAKGFDIWIYDVVRRTTAQRTFLGSINFEVAWAPDSSHLVYGDGKALWWMRADGAGQPQRLADNLVGPRPYSFAPLMGGKTRLAFSPTGASLPDVMTLTVDMTDPDRPAAGVPEAFLADPGQVEVDPAFSPDGHFIAYALGAGATGEDVYVRPFPGPGGQWKVSSAGGKAPVWSPATRQLLFMGNDERIMAVDYTISGNSFSSGAPYPWSPTSVRRIGVQQNFDVAPDGKRIVAFPRLEAQERPEQLHATFLLNFGDELRRRFTAR